LGDFDIDLSVKYLPPENDEADDETDEDSLVIEVDIPYYT
jgi:hypothetical protein